MAPPRHAAAKWGQYLGARLAAAALDSFDADQTLEVAGSIGRLLYQRWRRRRQRALDHLQFAYPTLDHDQRDAIARGSFEHMVKLVFEVVHTPRKLHRDAWPAHVTFGDIRRTLALLNRGKPTILVTGHLGNWEVVGLLLTMLGYHISALARPIDNPLINDWLMGIRKQHGLEIITKFNATQRMVQVIEQGGTLAFIADQNAGDKGMFVPFFGKLASTYKSVALLAIQRNVPIVCGYAHRDQRGYHYQVATEDVIMPDDWQNQPDPIYYVTARYMRAIEMMVRRRPEQYLWIHRRWKSRPAFERTGKPMPAPLRRQLEALPWMDQTQMEQLLNNRGSGS